MDRGIMKLNDDSAPGPCSVLNLNEIKQEAPESVDIPLELLEHDVPNIKSETVTTDDKFISTRLNTLHSEVISYQPFELMSEMLAKSGDVDIKQELLHEELDIKTEVEEIQETHFDEKLNWDSQLSNHMELPSVLKHFKCNFCDYSFKRKGYLKLHLLTHTVEKPYKCNFCDYSCKAKHNLNRHLRIHAIEKPFKCNICNYSTAWNSCLQMHLRYHTTEDPFKCHYCDYRCRSSRSLMIHLCSHTGKIFLRCNICDYSCMEKSVLKKHLRTHATEKPFKCNICEYSGRQKNNLKNHLKTHSKPRLNVF